MSVISVETQQLGELQSATGLSENDLLYVELVDGGSKKMRFGDLMQTILEAIGGGGTGGTFLTANDIVDVMTNDGKKVPAASLLYALNAGLEPLTREIQCINAGIDGKIWTLDELMDHVGNGDYHKFAIGDAFIDGSSTWRIFAKRFYPKWAFDGVAGDDAPHHIVCMPDASLGSYKFANSNVNTGGYAASLMPGNCTTEYNKLSEKLKKYVKEFQIYENNKGAWAAAKRLMRPPTIVEMTGSNGWADQYSGGVSSQFPLAKAGRHRVKGYWYWCMDPAASNTTNFCTVADYGISASNTASNEGALRPVIVLGQSE